MSRPGVIAALAAGAVALAAPQAVAGAVLAGAAPSERATYTVYDHAAYRTGSRARLGPIAPGFDGVSIDYCNITKYTGATANPILARLLLNLSPVRPVVRIGGAGPDVVCAGVSRPITVAPSAIAALARRTDARLIL